MAVAAIPQEYEYSLVIQRKRQQTFSHLHGQVAASRLLDRQYGYYLKTLLLAITVFLAGVFALISIENVWFRLFFLVPYLTFSFVTFGFLEHDAGHKQIFKRRLYNDLAGLACGFVTGSTFFWWVFVHDRHHEFPNDPHFDADANAIVLNLLALLPAKNLLFSGWLKNHPAEVSVGLRFITAFWMKVQGVKYILHMEDRRYQACEAVSFVLHHTLYLGGLYYLMGFRPGLVFALLHWSLIGFYHGTVFAPNHKGMVVFEEAGKVDFFTRQVLTTRDTYTNPWLDLVTGGLARQLTHHLFPVMPRNNLKKGEEIVQEALKVEGLPHEKVSNWQAQLDVLNALREPKPLIKV